MAKAQPYEHTNMSDEYHTKLCDSCSFQGIHTEASTFCQVCSEYLCNSCEVVHQSLKITRDHELKPLVASKKLTIKQKALVSELMKCETHHSETLKHFCEVHDLAICVLCKETIHRNCKVTSLDDTARDEKIRTENGQLVSTTRTLLSKFEEIKESRLHDKQKVQEMSTELKQELQTMKDDIIARAEEMEREMLDKLSSEESKLMNAIEKDITTSDDMVKQFKEIINSFETLNHDVPEASFVLMKKWSTYINKGEEIKEDILQQMRPVTLRFQHTDKMKFFIDELTSMGTIETDETNFLNMSSLADPQNVDVGKERVTGSTFLPDGELVICQYDISSVKVFTADFVLKEVIKFESNVWDVAAVSDKEVIVTLTDDNSIQFIDVSKKVEKRRAFNVGLKCWGIDCKGDRIYVSCHQEDGRGGTIQVLTMDGTAINTFKTDQGYPYYLTVNRSGDKIAVNTNDESVTCFNGMGIPLYTYTDSRLHIPCGLLLDSLDNLMVCGWSSNNIHVVKNDGSKQRVILTSGIGVQYPNCLAYRPGDTTLVVGLGSSYPLMIFKCNNN